jgi:hypothetical protein
MERAMFRRFLRWLNSPLTHCPMCGEKGLPGEPGHEECYELWAIR